MRSLVPTKSNGTENGTSAIHRHLPLDANRMFDRLLGDFWGATYPATSQQDGAPMEIIELDDSIQISVEVPGIDPNELDISLTGQVLTLSAEKRDERESDAGHRTYTERQFGSFRRSIKLPCPVEVEQVKAEHKFGVVTITLQKSEAVRPKRIEVQVIG